MAKSLDGISDFLDRVSAQGFVNPNTANARKTACTKFFTILEPDQRTIEYVTDNLEVIKHQFQNLNPDVTGSTADEYARRVQTVLKDFAAWSEDRGAWEKRVTSKQSAAADRPPRAPRSETWRVEASVPGAAQRAVSGKPRVVVFPIRPDFEMTVTLPPDLLTLAELRKVAYYLLPYAKDWEPTTDEPRGVFPMLEQRG